MRELEASGQELTDKQQETLDRANRLEEKLKETGLKLTEAEQQINNLRKSEEKKLKIIQNQVKQSRLQKTNIQDLQQQLSNMENNNTIFQEDADKLQNSINKLQQENSDLITQQNIELQQEREQRQQAIENLEITINGLEQEKIQLKNDSLNNQNDLQDERENNKKLDKRIEDLLEQQSVLKNKNIDNEKKIQDLTNSLTKSLNNQQLNKREVKTEIQKLKFNNDSKNIEINRLKKEINKIKSENNEIEKESNLNRDRIIEKQRQSLDNQNEKIQNLMKREIILKNSINQKTQEVKELKEEREDILQQAREKIKQLENENEEFRKLTGQETDSERMEREFASIEGGVDELEREPSIEIREILEETDSERMDRELASLEGGIDELEREPSILEEEEESKEEIEDNFEKSKKRIFNENIELRKIIIKLKEKENEEFRKLTGMKSSDITIKFLKEDNEKPFENHLSFSSLANERQELKEQILTGQIRSMEIDTLKHKLELDRQTFEIIGKVIPEDSNFTNFTNNTILVTEKENTLLDEALKNLKNKKPEKVKNLGRDLKQMRKDLKNLRKKNFDKFKKFKKSKKKPKGDFTQTRLLEQIIELSKMNDDDLKKIVPFVDNKPDAILTILISTPDFKIVTKNIKKRKSKPDLSSEQIDELMGNIQLFRKNTKKELPKPKSLGSGITRRLSDLPQQQSRSNRFLRNLKSRIKR